MQSIRESFLNSGRSLFQTYVGAFSKKLAITVVALAAFMLVAGQTAQAHTTRICWQDVGAVTTFYAGSYHSPFEGPSPVGNIIVDGFAYPFSGWIYAEALPAGVQCSQPDPFAPGWFTTRLSPARSRPARTPSRSRPRTQFRLRGLPSRP